MNEPIGLSELGFTFAVENVAPTSNLKIELHQVEWDGKTGIKAETQLELEPCPGVVPDLISNFAK